RSEARRSLATGGGAPALREWHTRFALLARGASQGAGADQADAAAARRRGWRPLTRREPQGPAGGKRSLAGCRRGLRARGVRVASIIASLHFLAAPIDEVGYGGRRANGTQARGDLAAVIQRVAVELGQDVFDRIAESRPIQGGVFEHTVDLGLVDLS